ncbi:2-polyprenyl-6-methoxyphenol hydroxylase-like FAD-dependent oxidoreductase [Rhizobium sp. BK650]|uniref:FAD-dependent oxidoreductase n=1 Tax=Rhizobium sp. BK650 TaxID=2586990 RepID=UPI00160E6D0B|nr:FAD-dependent oxidoreductase [Rhizobium sp. BK650]MBB3655580.1 2-polyprenyl-6-methoxyphenol hydroxylase-like FAD-dependent oxidoreductase [Rhizobium sp. BK650]
MSQKISADVLICGAGAAGLTLAIELARRAIPFRIIEQMQDPFCGSRGKGIQPRTQEVFEDLGVIDRIVAAGGTYPPQCEYREDGSEDVSDVMTLPAPTDAEPYQIPLLVPQFLTERVLRERLQELGHQVDYGVKLVAFEQDEDGVTARMAGPAQEVVERFRYLVGADGGRSFVRHTLAIDFPGKTLGVRALVADVEIEGLSRDFWHRFGEGDMARQISICPLAGTGMFQVQGPIALDGDVDLSAAGLSAILADRSGRSDLVVTAVSWASAFHMNARLADRYRVGRVFLAGDAAHTHPPTGGQGLNTSVQDAYNLGWKLAAVLAGAPNDLLDTYEAERRPIAAQMLGLATSLLEAAKAGLIRRGREVHQLDLCYPGSRLAMENPARDNGALAGDRAPDAIMQGAAGQQIRLFNLFCGTHWTLIGHEVEAGDGPRPRPGLHIHRTGPRGDLIDTGAELKTHYGLSSGEWVLVRPDGYIGAIVTADELPSLEPYLAFVGLEIGSDGNGR